MKKEILITGGAGYIGSHAVRFFIQNNYKVVVLDNLVTGHEAALVDSEVIFYRGSVADEPMLNEILNEEIDRTTTLLLKNKNSEHKH